MQDKRALLIINPNSGTRSKKGLGNAVKNRLEPQGIAVEICETITPGDAKRLASEAVEANFQAVITAGGDGTVNEVANVIAGSDSVLGILPYGSGNGLARSLGIPQDVFAALKIIEKGHYIDCDRGIVNNHPFYCTFGVGFDAAVSEKFASMKKRGRVTYIRSAFREFFKYQSETYTLKVEDKVLAEKAFLIAVCNAPQYGNNAYIGPKAKLTDGFLDITVVHADHSLRSLIIGMDMLTGMLDKNRWIDTLRVPALTIERENEGWVHLDGEPMIMGSQLNIRCEEKALKVFSPLKQADFVPFISPLRAILDDLRYDVMDKFRKLD